MAAKFGTSGLRGLVTELTDAVVADHVRAFLTVCDIGTALYIGRDLRDSSPHLSNVVAEAARTLGVPTVDCGALPTPALALAAFAGQSGAVMITGSHIPADRNGLKFYSVDGEVTKENEQAILGALVSPAPESIYAGSSHDKQAGVRFHDRYFSAFGADALKGARIGVWSHSSVGRDLLITLLRDLGALATELGRSESFVPVDTEAVDILTREKLSKWAAGGNFDSIVSTDGDADRPLLTDATGKIVPGDVLGQITAQLIEAEMVITPVSSNGGADLGGHFDVVRTKIGSPYVIAAMNMQSERKVVGYEANGGFLLGFDAAGPVGPLPALLTRDCVLPILATLIASSDKGYIDVAGRVSLEPARFTAADRIQDAPIAVSKKILANLFASSELRERLLTSIGLSHDHIIETTDGLRMTDSNGIVVHLRPSGNAPELRIYIESDNAPKSDALLLRTENKIREMFTSTPA